MPATFDVVLRFPLPATLSHTDVITYLHAYEPLIRVNPYLVSFNRLAVDLNEIIADPFFTEEGTNIVKYEVHDRVPVVAALGWFQPVVFPAIFQTFATGVRVRADAAAATRVRSIYGVERAQGEELQGMGGGGGGGEGGAWEFVERSHVECYALLKPFVQKQFLAAHSDLGQKALDYMVAEKQKTAALVPGGQDSGGE